ncbi:M14 family metallopeptidase [Flavobacterium azooxidireducens]|uniref:M14 family metallopeptidase n=1 Tax=Flavobacterium azooxidireducens TaxID=1871076 RepID=A0ABY4KE85_9FLAO|nr:M14 family metallopeptidase [Flavobacterium azooxidireducens]UPQ79115.1 M14 family metallopeptidase [Flavobacterium azooxidireducens]
MEKNLIIYFLLTSFFTFSQKSDAFLTPYEKGNKNQTAMYQEAIDFYNSLTKEFKTIKLMEMGLTDSGEPLRLLIFNPEKDFDLKKNQNKAMLLINNNIHPSEPDGVDASMMLIRDLATGKITVPKNTIIAVISFYNIGGTLNRNSFSRANQNGPESYGFRGNDRNFDLNRDFIKSDTKNARSFAEIFHLVNPDVFIDNHVSNGADYQYVLTYIQTQHQKLGNDLGNYLKDEMTPKIRTQLLKKKIESIPYVTVYGATPEKGFTQMMDLPRYSTGYASLFHTIGYMPETHMLKKYEDRVKVTYEFMLETIAHTDANYLKIKYLRTKNQIQFKPKSLYTLQWKIDSTKVEQIDFLGFESGYKKSEISGKDRLFYDQKKLFKKQIPYYHFYKPQKQVEIPSAYIIPKSWWNVIDLLKLNKVEMVQFEKDTLIEVEKYKIADYKTATSAYEGHYPHSNTTVNKLIEKIVFKKGDYFIPTQQFAVKYLMETLEPEAPDSFFNWNFFDGILQQKEGYSAYVFEDLAVEILAKNPTLKEKFEKKKAEDKSFADNGSAQLDWIYKNSEYYESSHLTYPVYRVLN